MTCALGVVALLHLLLACAAPEPGPQGQQVGCAAITGPAPGAWPEGLPQVGELLPARALWPPSAAPAAAGQGIRFACLSGWLQQPLQVPEQLQGLAHRLPAPDAAPSDWLRWLACAGNVGAACVRRCPALPTAAALEPQVQVLLADVPDAGLRALLQPAVLGLAQAHEALQALRPGGLGADDVLALLQQGGVLDGVPRPAHEQALALDRLGQALDETDWAALVCVGLMAGEAVQTLVAGLRAWLARPDASALRWQADSPWGRLWLDTGSHDDVHEVSDHLLLIDAGGNDVYRFVEDSRARPLGVLIDLAGDDHYVSSAPGAGPAVALGGVQLLWDGGGHDRYEGADHALSQAAAVLGVSWLVDESGDDVYEAALAAQAWALGGLALLLDGAGDDQYRALSMAQGSTQPMGAALLADLAGHDRYTLAAQPLRKPSSQLPERNLSMGQGAAMGWWRRDDAGQTRPGGLGILLDRAGDDVYEAQVFAQGAGYLRGTGLLIDGGGADRFNAAWYAMGAGAHQGVGLLLKRGQGADRYRLSHASGLGMAHDASLGVLLDEGGDDRYDAAELAYGAAHDEGVGLFIDGGGADRLRLRGQRCRAFGAAVRPDGSGADEPPGQAPTQALFLRGPGRGVYALPPHADCAPVGRQRRWQRAGPGFVGEGLGWDGGQQP